MTGTVQGNDAVLSFDKNGWVPFMCGTDISISMTSDTLPIRTVGSGHWKKVTYQNATFSLNISGLLVFDDVNWTDWDTTDNWLNFTNVKFRCSFSDKNGNTRSVQGYGIVTTNTLSISTGALVKADFDIEGNGELMVFDGLIPCDSAIATITPGGLASIDGTILINYSYTGSPAQVKYRVDNTGNYLYAAIDAPIYIYTMPIGSHSVELIPVCLNGYEGDGMEVDFTVTLSLTCPSVITAINVSSTSAYPTYTGTPTYYKFRQDGSAGWTQVPIGYIVPIAGQSVGAHSIEMVPICSNGAEGTGMIQNYTVSVQPAQSLVSYSFSSIDPFNTFQIYVNGVPMVSTTTPGSSSIIVATGSTVKGVLIGINLLRNMNLRTNDSTLGTILDNRSAVTPNTLQYSFTANGDDYAINATITP